MTIANWPKAIIGYIIAFITLYFIVAWVHLDLTWPIYLLEAERTTARMAALEWPVLSFFGSAWGWNE